MPVGPRPDRTRLYRLRPFYPKARHISKIGVWVAFLRQDLEYRRRMQLGVHRPLRPSCAALAAWSRGALDRPLAHDAELTLATPSDERVIAGAFDRGLVRRGSGGPHVRVGPGTLWLTLALARPSALVPCTAEKLVNRYVRPILRALTKTAGIAHYFGRDWISVAKRPVGWIGFSHDAASGRATIEAFLAVRVPFSGPRASFLGREPATLEEVAKTALYLDVIADAIVDAYGGGEAFDLARADEIDAEANPPGAQAPWSARVAEVIGDVCAGRDASGRLRVGGELLASRDAIAALEAALARLSPSELLDEATVAGFVDDAFRRPGVVLEGVRSLKSVRDAILGALRTV
jgi:hypothetical protein